MDEAAKKGFKDLLEIMAKIVDKTDEYLDEPEKDPQLRVVHVRAQDVLCKDPQIKIIDNNLEAMHKLVCGYIETFSMFRSKKFVYFAIVNEEGYITDQPFNKEINGQKIYGDIFITKSALHGGEFISLTEAEAKKFAAVFRHTAISFV